jgi:hypothetical protein
VDERIAIPTLLNGAIGAALLALLSFTGFRDRSQMLWTLVMMAFGLFATYRVLAPKLTVQIYGGSWHFHFLLQPLTWVAVAFVVGTMLIWGNQAGWAVMALGYLIGSRFALVMDGMNRLRA